MAASARIKQEADEDVVVPRRSFPKKKRRSWSRWTAGVAARLAVWYALVIVVFFCPSSPSQLDASSSAVCKPYLQLRDWSAPYVLPLYQTHLAPHVDKARPYADVAYKKFYQPAFARGKQLYVDYAAPRVSQVQHAGLAGWNANVQPRLDELTKEASKQYASTLEPHVSKAYDAVNPYIEQSKQVAQQQYESTILPSYRKALPHVQTALERGSHLATTVVWPYAQAVAHHVYVFLARQVWPHVRILYGENVQPQLVKIRERLSSYREGKRVESAMSEADPLIKSNTDSSTAAAVTDVISSVYESVTAPAAQPSATKVSKESLIEDLNAWKVKFAKAADKGTEDLKQRVADIVASQMSSQVSGTGQAHLTRLEEASRSSLSSLQSDINAIVDTLPEEVYEEDEQPAIDKSHAKIKAAGKSVKNAAQKLRSWKQSVLDETDSLVKDATDSTLDVIDHIRDLGLQEIGMRWASHDDTSYEHWSEYHSLKKTFDKWHKTVENAAYQHESLSAVKKAAEDVESEGMALAEDTAKELVRLKQVALWKIRARDTSDDFSTRVLPPAAIRAKEAVVEAFDDARQVVFGADSDEAEGSYAADASENASSLADAAVSSVASVQSAASEAVVDPLASAAETPLSSAASLSSRASSSMSKASESASESAASVASSLAETVGKGAAAASSAASEAVSLASSATKATPKPKASSIADAASDASSQASRAAARASRSAASVASSASSAAGKVAQIPADQAQDAADAVGDGVESATKKIKEAVYGTDDSSIPDASSIASKASKSASKSSRSASSAAASVKTRASKLASSASASIATGAASGVSEASDYMSEHVASASASIVSAVNAAGEKVADYTSSLASAASSATN